MTFNDFLRNLPISSDLAQSIARDLARTAVMALRQSPRRRLAAHVGTLGVGIAVGAGLALLYAPKSGRQLRRELSSRFDGAVHETQELVDRKLREANAVGQA